MAVQAARAAPNVPADSTEATNAWHGVDHRTIFFGLAAVAVSLTLLNTVNQLLPAIRDGEFPWWFRAFTILFLAQALALFTIVRSVALAIQVSPRAGGIRMAALSASILVATPACVLFKVVAHRLAYGPDDDAFTFQIAPYFGIRYAFLGIAIAAVAQMADQQSLAWQSMHRTELARLSLEREIAEARLLVLQAQVEPHFLFNTLANLRRLYQTEKPAGRQMLDDLMHYLAIALPRMRDRSSTLERESSLLTAYLNLQRIRMGRRLRFEIDFPQSLLHLEVPSMMLITLVENCIKHGLNPMLGGGSIRVSAQANATHLTVLVSDDGRGFAPDQSGTGVGLSNIRSRLDALHGSQAALTLVANEPRGVAVYLLIPLSGPVGLSA